MLVHAHSKMKHHTSIAEIGEKETAARKEQNEKQNECEEETMREKRMRENICKTTNIHVTPQQI